RRHQHATAGALEHGVVGAAMTERQLVRPVPGGEREQLVAETDPEHGNSSDQVAERRDLVFKRLGVTRTVRQQHPVEANELVARRVIWEDREGASWAGRPETVRYL